MENRTVCTKCKNTGRVLEPNGEVHTCWDCLSSGRMNVHSQKLEDSKIKV